ncbi:MAG: nucleotide-binding protein, partial [Thermoprotei archaeon]
EDKDVIKYGIQTRRYIALDTIAVEKLLSGKSLENVLQDLALRLK